MDKTLCQYYTNPFLFGKETAMKAPPRKKFKTLRDRAPFFIRLSYKMERLPFWFLSDKKTGERRQKLSCSFHH